jgi:hypothetical protein
MRMRILAAVLCSGLVLAVPAFAQQSATLLTKSGERISGELVDMGGSDFTMRVNGQERRVAIGDVAVLDFGGTAQNLPAEELDRLAAGQNVIVLKNGQSFEGKLYDVGGTTPLRITFTTGGQQRDFTSTEVGRIYLSRAPASAATTSTSRPAGSSVISLPLKSGASTWTGRRREPRVASRAARPPARPRGPSRSRPSGSGPRPGSSCSAGRSSSSPRPARCG